MEGMFNDSSGSLEGVFVGRGSGGSRAKSGGSGGSGAVSAASLWQDSASAGEGHYRGLTPPINPAQVRTDIHTVCGGFGRVGERARVANLFPWTVGRIPFLGG